MKEVLIPGDPERTFEKEALAKGIKIEDKLWQELCKTCDKYGINISNFVK